MTDNDITHEIICAAIEVHKRLGPGLVESAYEECLPHELRPRNIRIDRQIAVPVVYKETKLESGYRIDLLDQGRIVVELKSVESLAPHSRGDHFDVPSIIWTQDRASHQLQRGYFEGRRATIYRVKRKSFNTENAEGTEKIMSRRNTVPDA
jgi:GxxExxY protein